MNVVDRKARAIPGRRSCPFCSEWSYVSTEVDLNDDVIEAFDRHLRRHAQALTVRDAELSIFEEMVRPLSPSR